MLPFEVSVSPPPPSPPPFPHHQRKEENVNLSWWEPGGGGGGAGGDGGSYGGGGGGGADEHTACNRLLAIDKIRHSQRHQTHQITGRLSQWVNHFSAGVVRSCGSPSCRHRNSDQRGGNFKTSGALYLSCSHYIKSHSDFRQLRMSFQITDSVDDHFLQIYIFDMSFLFVYLAKSLLTSSCYFKGQVQGLG